MLLKNGYFFLDGIIETAEVAIETVKKITILREEDIFKISRFNKTSSEKAIIILRKLFSSPVVTASII